MKSPYRGRTIGTRVTPPKLRGEPPAREQPIVDATPQQVRELVEKKLRAQRPSLTEDAIRYELLSFDLVTARNRKDKRLAKRLQAKLDQLLATGKFAQELSGHVSSLPEHPTSEGLIGRSGTTKKFRNASDGSVHKLPARPRLWNQDFRGKAAGERDRVLIAHIEEVYGAYLPEHANEMREYLGRKDPKLLAAIKAFGFKNLPDHLRMPSIRQKVIDRIARAAAGEYDDMTPEEKKSVRTATQRRLSPKI